MITATAANAAHRHKLTRTKVGHFSVEAELGGKPIEMLVDTGAASTVVDVAWCQQHDIPLEATGKFGGGAGGVGMPIYALRGLSLTIDGVALRSNDIYALDLSHVNHGLERNGATKVAGVIGADVLALQEAVIDYAAETLSLKSGLPE
jgi:hypothetical protein